MKILENLFYIGNSYKNNKVYKKIRIFGFEIEIVNFRKTRKLDIKLDIKYIKDEIDGFYHLLNTCIDIQKIPQAKGILRDFQELTIALFDIVEIIFKKHDITYWLDYGTLLGAVRHKGYVPWDDDLDIGILRKDLEKAQNVLNDELKKYEFWSNIRFKGDKLYYKKDEYEFCLLDIFIYDNYYEKVDYNSNKYNEIIIKMQECSKQIKNDFNNEKIDELEAKYVLESNKAKEQTAIFSRTNALPYGEAQIFNYETIFPLRKLQFEGRECFVPNDCDRYLSCIYGNYMLFPKNIPRLHILSRFSYQNQYKNINFKELTNELYKIKENLNE